MDMSFEILDPTHEEASVEFSLADRPANLRGATIGIISNGKQGTRPFFDSLEDELRNTFGVAEVVRVTKSNYSAPAERTIFDSAKRWSALISGIGD